MSAQNKANVEELNKMVLSGKAMDAFERFYAEDVVMQENDQPPTIGKAANRKREIEAMSGIAEFRSAKVLSVAAAGDKTFVEWHNDFKHKQYGDRKFHQVAVQTWKDGKIVHERFYYGT
jgi:ketosteroid isomerase-like protein